MQENIAANLLVNVENNLKTNYRKARKNTVFTVFFRA